MQISVGEYEVVVDSKVYRSADHPDIILPPPTPLPVGYLSPNFTREEFTCNHCGKLPADMPPPELVAILQQVRDHFNAPVVVASGYRCPIHNANVGGAKNSQHLVGTAADIAVQGVHAHTVYDYISKLLAGTGGLGKYDTFTHVDVRLGNLARW
jgi:uncharacterized protein YcbK (DUF882 family)